MPKKKPSKWIRRWDGGRVFRDRDERERYVLEQMRGGERYTFTLPVGADPDDELTRFRKNPEGYRPEGDANGGAVRLTVDEIERFERFQLEEKGRSAAHVRSVKHYLCAWSDDLEGADLRRVKVDDLYRMLDRHKRARNYRIIALKAFCTYLVKRQRIKLGENPAALLEGRKRKPDELKEVRGYTAEQLEATYAAIGSQRIRDAFCLAAKTGMHYTEILRLCRPGQGEITELSDKSTGIAAVIRVIHKSRRDHRQSIDAQCLAALRRLLVSKPPSPSRIHECMMNIAMRKKRDPVLFRWMRHTFITMGNERGRLVRVTEGGIALSDMAAAVNHRGMLMAKDHYLQSAVPPMVVLPITLSHPEDPTPLKLSARAAG